MLKNESANFVNVLIFWPVSHFFLIEKNKYVLFKNENFSFSFRMYRNETLFFVAFFFL